ncbi:MAG: Crp/Fnr family transcriptional regulator [Atopobiaceae bacterium]
MATTAPARPLPANVRANATASTRLAKELQPYLPVIRRTKLFAGIDSQEAVTVMPCLGARVVRCEPGEYALRPGQAITHMYLVLDGEIHVVREDWSGNRTLVASKEAGSSFGDVYACSPSQVPQVAAVAEKPSVLLRLDVRKVMSPCSATCPFHLRLLSNFVAQLADSTILLQNKLRYLSQRTTRQKLMTFFEDCSRQAGSRTFDLPYTRQELADFLAVNRSAMSSELSRMQADGIVRLDHRRITLLANFQA